MLRHDIFDSAAWQSLSCPARDAFLFIRRRFNGSNNGRISCSFREMANYMHVSPATIGRAINMLIDRGLIVVTEGAAFNMKQRQARRYALTHEKIGDSLPTHEWRGWKPNQGLPVKPISKPDSGCGKNQKTVSLEKQDSFATDTDAHFK